MMNKKIIGILVCMLLVGTVLPISGALIIDNTASSNMSGSTLYVGGSGEGNYTRIQDAIDNASNGDTVFVYDDSSPYYENVVVDKSINLIGEDRETTVINDKVTGYAVSVSADWVYISGFIIRQGIYGIYINSDYNTIAGNTISYNLYGIYLYESSGNTITGNQITSNNKHGVYLKSSSNNNITGNIISNNEDGMFLGGHTGTDLGKIISDAFHSNIILKNNFLGNKRNAFFQNSFSNQWKQNYWNRPRILPKLIRGELCWIMNGPMRGEYHFNLFNIDWNPAKEPYDI